jgi:uncharacterized protein YbaR (Trm112 family)
MNTSPPDRPAHTVDPKLLEILVCPVCKATVELKADNSGLKCVQCRRVYPIRDDIPVMLIDEGTKWIGTAVADLPVPPPAE